MEEKDYGYHKLEVGDKIRVYKNTYNDKDFYKFQTLQKNYDGTIYKPYIDLQFRKDVELKNGTDIIVRQFVENHRPNPKDEYHSIQYYRINKFDIVENQELIERDALDEFRSTLDDNFVEIDDDFLD